jgi:hypothetical protein
MRIRTASRNYFAVLAYDYCNSRGCHIYWQGLSVFGGIIDKLSITISAPEVNFFPPYTYLAHCSVIALSFFPYSLVTILN